VQRWFKELTGRRLRRGTFTSAAALIEAFQTWVTRRNQDPKPFIWHAAAGETPRRSAEDEEPCHKSINHAAPGDGRVGGASTEIRCANRAQLNAFGSQAGSVAASRGEDQVEGCRWHS